MHYSSELLFDEGQVPRLILSECIISKSTTRRSPRSVTILV